MTSVDEVIMDIVSCDTANIQGLDVEDCDVSFVPRTMVSTADLLVYPQPSDVRVEEVSHQDSSQAGPSGRWKDIRREVTPSASFAGIESSGSSQQNDAASINERSGNFN